MSEPPYVAALPGGRLHLQHGPIDLVVRAEGDPAACRAAYAALVARFATVLGELCDELPTLRAEIGTGPVRGEIAARMVAAVLPHGGSGFITPMAAVAGAVADEMLASMTAAARLQRAYVNNGGDIAVYLAPGEVFRTGLVGRPDRPALFATAEISASDGIGGIATSGWRGRSFSLGIADAVTVCATSAAEADAAATVIANALDLPGHPGVHRAPARSIQADTDLGNRLVTRHVGTLRPGEAEIAVQAGARVAESLLASRLIAAAVLHCQGITRCVSGLRRVLMVEPAVSSRAPPGSAGQSAARAAHAARGELHIAGPAP